MAAGEDAVFFMGVFNLNQATHSHQGMQMQQIQGVLTQGDASMSRLHVPCGMHSLMSYSHIYSTNQTPVKVRLGKCQIPIALCIMRNKLIPQIGTSLL